MNRRNFLRAATGCAVDVAAPVAISIAVVMVPKQYGMTSFVPGLVGRSYDYVIIDDPIKNETISDAQREAVLAWLRKANKVIKYDFS